MDPKRWEKLEELVEQALAMPPAQREEFLSETCGRDTELRREAESLLSHSDQALKFMSDFSDKVITPSLSEVNEQHDQPWLGTKSAFIHQTIAHYYITEKLGEGGMGVVYKARDTKLDRTVALKFLPSQLGTNATEKQRFLNEAKAASALDHNNICSIYSIEETDDGNLFIVMAYYEGMSLKKKLERGPLPVNDAVNYAIQIASGLQKAHDNNIVHRDLKPANIFITTDDQIKIIDFGIAKAAQQTVFTKPGTTLGTVPYMSPEQARGNDVDHRTDIWALGVVIYEMISSRLPFHSEYNQAIIISILNEDPEQLTSLKPNVPMEVERIVRKALEKYVNDRYQHITEMIADLSVLQGDKLVGTGIAPAPNLISVNRIYTIVPIVILIIAGIWYFQSLSDKPGEIVTTQRQVTYQGNAAFAEISPDGKMVAYGLFNESNNFEVYVQEISGGQPLKIYNGSIAARQARIRWSPDGEEILIQVGEGSYLVPKIGGLPRQISEYGYASWSPDGLYLATFYLNWKKIHLTNRISGESISIPLEGDFLWLRDIDWSPNGDFLLFLTSDHPIYTLWSISQDGAVQNKILEFDKQISSPRWSGDGNAIYFILNDNFHQTLMKINISAGTGQAWGKEQLIERDIGLQQISIARNVNLIAYTRYSQHTNIWLLKHENEEWKSEFTEIELTSGTRPYIGSPKISPDGKMIAFTWGREGDNNLFIIPTDGGEPQQLSFFSGVHFESPVWSPDGNQIAFVSDYSGSPKVWEIPKSGGTLSPLPIGNPHINSHLSWSPGENILYQMPGNRNFNIIDLNTGEVDPLVEDDSVGWMFSPQFSPKGNNVAVFWNRLKQRGIWIISPEESSKKFVSEGSIIPIRWSLDGLKIMAFDLDRYKIVSIFIDDGNKEILHELQSQDQSGRVYLWSRADATPDGKKIAVPKSTSISDIWMMEILEN